MSRQPLATYQKLCTEFYDLEQHRDGAQAMALYMEYAQRAHGPILEPMCGTGRFLIPMLQAGFDAEGFDASSYMLDAFKQKYRTLSAQEAPVWEQFVQDFDKNKNYNLIFLPYGSWGLITSLEDSKNGLKNMYQHLAPGGKLVLEIETINSVPEPCGIWRRGVHTRADGSHIAINTIASYQPSTQLFRSLCRYESIINNKITQVETEDFQMYLYRFEEMDDLLQEAGFKQIKKYQDYSKTPATDLDAPILIYECTK